MKWTLVSIPMVSALIQVSPFSNFLILFVFSFNQPHHVLTLEQSSAGGGDSSVDSCIYEYNGTKVCFIEMIRFDN